MLSGWLDSEGKVSDYILDSINLRCIQWADISDSFDKLKMYSEDRSFWLIVFSSFFVSFGFILLITMLMVVPSNKS